MQESCFIFFQENDELQIKKHYKGTDQEKSERNGMTQQQVLVQVVKFVLFLVDGFDLEHAPNKKYSRHNLKEYQ